MKNPLDWTPGEFVKWLKSRRERKDDQDALHIFWCVQAMKSITEYGITSITGLPQKRVDYLLAKMRQQQFLTRRDYNQQWYHEVLPDGVVRAKEVADAYNYRVMVVKVPQTR